MSLRSTAIHEAGHAVIARVLGLSCGGVTIIADEDSAGHAITGDAWETVADWELQHRYRDVSAAMRGRMIALMAGGEAETVILGRAATGDGGDRRWIDIMADSSDSGIAVDDWPRWEARLRRQSRRLIRRHRKTIERVAAALRAQGSLSPEDVAQLMDNE